MIRIPGLAFVSSSVAVVLTVGVCGVGQASPHYGGNCSYCHTAEQPDAMTITGETEEADGLKVFEAEPGGTVDFGFDVSNPGQPVYYRLVVRGLDRLDGEDENGTPLYFPRLYTPDPAWATTSPAGDQYLFREGQFYGQGPAFMASTFDYQLEVGPEVEPGLYDLIAYVAGGFPVRAPGQNPTGGWSFTEDFQLRVVPEPASLVLVIAGVCLLCIGRWWRRRVVPVAIVLMFGFSFLTANVAHAYPSRSGDCSICHSIPGPSAQTGDFEIKDGEGNTVTTLTVEAGESTEFAIQYTNLVEDALNPGTVRRAYVIVDGLDLLSVDAGPPPAYADIPYTEPKYTATNVGEEEGQWHTGRYVNEPERYIWKNGQYFAQDSTDPNALLSFPLTLDADVAPGDYQVRVTMAGGRPLDADYHNGWFVTRNLTLTVMPAAGGMALPILVPEPGVLVLLASALPVLGLWFWRRRRV